LRGARGEVLGVQVLRSSSEEAGMSLAIDDMLVQAWRVDDVKVVRPSTEMYGPSTGAGSYPDVLVPGSGGDVKGGRDVLFDVGIPSDAVPGAHHGMIRIGARTYDVSLEVVPVTLPSISDAPRVWGYYNPHELERTKVDEARAVAMFRDFGVAATPELTLDDADRRAAQVAGMRFVPVLLPASKHEIQRDARAWAAWAARTHQQPFAIPIDEPRTLIDRLRVRVLARWIHEAGGGVWLAVTDAPSWSYGDDVDVFIAPGAPGHGPPDRRWTYNGAPPRAGAMIADTDGVAMRTWGWIAFRYDVPLWYIWDVAYWRDRHNAARRGLSKDEMPFVDDADAVTFDDGEDHGNLDGVLFYPPGLPSLRLAALRRGLEDRAMLDAVAACAGRAKADAIAARVVPAALGDSPPGDPGAWPTDEPPWDRARNELLDAMLACAREPH